MSASPVRVASSALSSPQAAHGKEVGSSSGAISTTPTIDLEPVKAFLQSALQGKLQGNPGPYNVIVHQFRAKDDPETLWRVVLALNSFTSLITQR